MNIGVPQPAEATEEKGWLDVVVRLVFGFNDYLDFIKCEVASAFLLCMGLEFPVYVLAWVFDYDAVSFCFVECYHYSCEQGFFIYFAEWLRFALLVFAFFVEVSDVRVEVFYESDEELFVDVVESDVFSLVGNHSLDGTSHQYGAGGLSVGFIFRSHIFAVGQETEFPCSVPVLKAEFPVLDVYYVLGFDGVGKTELFFVPHLVVSGGVRTKVEVQELVFPYAVDIAVKVNGLVAIL